jgi:hypothetical protein
LHLAVAIVAMAGCFGADETPRVQYDAPVAEPVATIEVPGGSAAGSGNSPASITLPTGVRAGQWLAFEGLADLGDPRHPSTLIMVELSFMHKGTRAVAQSAGAAGKVVDGKIQYRVELQCPRSAGKFPLEVSQSNGLPDSQRVLGQAELVVQ